MRQIRVLFAMVFIITSLVAAKDKKKNSVPAYVLQARTVLVLIDPNSGISPTDPAANKTAQDDVEKAFTTWGRLRPVLDAQTADLIVTVRKGSGKIVQPTIAGGRVNDRPVIVQSTDNSIRIGGQRGQDPSAPGRPQNTEPHPQTEIGPDEDMFVVYQGGVEDPLNRPPAWRYIGKGALRSPNLPAVAQFRKLLEDAEKRQNQKP